MPFLLLSALTRLHTLLFQLLGRERHNENIKIALEALNQLARKRNQYLSNSARKASVMFVLSYGSVSCTVYTLCAVGASASKYCKQKYRSHLIRS